MYDFIDNYPQFSRLAISVVPALLWVLVSRLRWVRKDERLAVCSEVNLYITGPGLCMIPLFAVARKVNLRQVPDYGWLTPEQLRERVLSSAFGEECLAKTEENRNERDLERFEIVFDIAKPAGIKGRLLHYAMVLLVTILGLACLIIGESLILRGDGEFAFIVVMFFALVFAGWGIILLLRKSSLELILSREGGDPRVRFDVRRCRGAWSTRLLAGVAPLSVKCHGPSLFGPRYASEGGGRVGRLSGAGLQMQLIALTQPDEEVDAVIFATFRRKEGARIAAEVRRFLGDPALHTMRLSSEIVPAGGVVCLMIAALGAAVFWQF